MVSALTQAGFPNFVVNARLFGREVDLLFPAQKLIVELDGWAYHSDRDTQERDRVKDAQALARGYVTVRITWRRWQTARAEVLAELANGPAKGRVALCAAGHPHPEGSARAVGALRNLFPGSDSLLNRRWCHQTH